ncbi:MAG TPA: hypothetical protein VGM32_11120 [Rhodopila sp.]
MAKAILLNVAPLLVAASAAVVLFLGIVHLLFTFRGSKLHPRDAALLQALRNTPLVISRKTTFWRAWTGFNASHSFGAILFGLIYFYLALWAPQLLFGTWFLRIVGLALLLGYDFLAFRYWFSGPLRYLVLATILYAAGLVAAVL